MRQLTRLFCCGSITSSILFFPESHLSRLVYYCTLLFVVGLKSFAEVERKYADDRLVCPVYVASTLISTGKQKVAFKSIVHYLKWNLPFTF